MEFLTAFALGGLLCALAQLLVNVTNLTPAHVMVMFVSGGAVVSGLGWYGALVEFGGAGATVPLTGFGHALMTGILDGLNEEGVIGLFTGGITGAAMGITVAVVAGYTVALLFNPKG